MNKQKKFFPVIIAIYLILIIFIIGILFTIPRNYANVQSEKYEEIKDALTKALDTHAEGDIFASIYDSYPVEFIVYNETKDTFLFMSLPIEDSEQLQALLNQQAVGKEEIFTHRVGDDTYSVWLAMYHLSPQGIVDTWFLYLFITAAVLFGIILYSTGYVALRIIRPLKVLRENIYKVSSYQLSSIVDALPKDDILSHELKTFSADLLQKFEQVETSYTSLERELKLENETANYRNQLFASLIHDIKSPMHLAQIQVEKVIQTNPEMDADALDYLVDAAAKNEQALADVSEIIQTVFADTNNPIENITTFDLVELLGDVSGHFIKRMTELQFDFEIISDDEVLLTANYTRIKQLIHNAFSNIITHAQEKANVLVECFVENNKVILSFYNDSPPFLESDLARVFDLFYHSGVSSISSGVGLFTVKKIVEENGGSVSFKNVHAGIKLLCTFSQGDLQIDTPLHEGDNNV